MKKKFNSDIIEHKIYQALKSLGLILLLLLWSSFLIIPLVIMGIDYENLNITSKGIILFLGDLTFLIFLIFLYRKTLIHDFKEFFQKNWKQNLKTAISYWLVGVFIMIISNLIISMIMNGKISDNEEAVREMILKIPLYMAFSLCIYAPLSEELIFRKSISEFTNHKYLYPLLSGLIFGGLHVITTIESTLDLLYLIPYSGLGIAFALLYQKTNNIFSSIIVHAFHNTLTLILFLVSYQLI